MISLEEHQEIVAVHRLWIEEKCPFDMVLGLKVVSLNKESACLEFDMNDHLIGDVNSRVLHGGAIAAVLDAAGSAILTYNVLSKLRDPLISDRVKRLKGVRTVDIRIDYLSPSLGKSFIAKAWILRSGKSIAVTRMQLSNEEDLLTATATGTYLVKVR